MKMLKIKFMYLFLQLLLSDSVYSQKFNKNESTNNTKWRVEYHDLHTVPTDNCALVKDTETENRQSDVEPSYTTPGYLEASWFTEFPLLPIVITTSKTLPDGNCKKQLALYQRDLKNGTMWAVQMFDASVKQIHGIIAGNTRHFGNFDQCYDLEAQIPSQDEDGGFVDMYTRYCLVDIEYYLKGKFPNSEGKLSLKFDPAGSVWEAIREKGDLRRFHRYRLQYAMCVPAACSPEDLELALKQPMIDFSNKTNLDVKVSVNPRYCQSRVESESLSLSAKLFCALLFILFALVISSTFLCREDNQDKQLGFTFKKFLLLFNARINTDSLCKITSQKCRGLDCIHILRFFFMCAIIFGHRLSRLYYNPVVNGYYFEKTFDTPALMIVHNGFIYVDIYFAIGGLLVSYGFLNEFEKKKSINFLKFIFLRFLRVIPVYLFVIAFYATVLTHLGSGPSWKSKVDYNYKQCRDYWWANILFINNYVNSGDLCMFQSWYLAVDFQCYIVALFILYAFCHMPRKFGYSFLGCVALLSCAIPFYYSYVHDVDPTMRLYPFYRENTECSYYVDYYVKTEMRISAYLMGLIAGALLYDSEFVQWRLSKAWSRILFIITLAFGPIIQLPAYRFLNPNIKTSPLEKALYAGFHHGLYAASISCLFLIITVGTGLDGLYNFLTPKWLQPLSRLTYCAYLTHPIMQIYDIGVARVSETFTVSKWIWNLFPDMLCTFFLSYLLVIAIEEPFRKLGKLLLPHEQDDKKCMQNDVQKKME